MILTVLGLAAATSGALLTGNRAHWMVVAAVSAIAGVAGAMTSLMQRMASERVTLNYEIEAQTIKHYGGYRPFVGMVFGLLSYAMIAGELFTLTPTGTRSTVGLHAALAFAAGFNERFARGLLARSGALPPEGDGDARVPASRPSDEPNGEMMRRRALRRA